MKRMKMINVWVALGISTAIIAGCAGNPEQKADTQNADTLAVQVSEELNNAMDSAIVVIDSAKQAIEESSRELDQLLNDLNK